MDCAACKKNFIGSDRIVQANCGCCVHLFKSDCEVEDDFCQKCNKNFKIYSSSPIVSIKARELSQSEEKEKTKKQLLEHAKEVAEKMISDKVEDLEKKYSDKFEEQRTINLELMKKLGNLSKSQENLMKLFVDHTKLIEALTKILNQEMAQIKRDIADLREDVDEINDELDLNDDYEEAEEN